VSGESREEDSRQPPLRDRFSQSVNDSRGTVSFGTAWPQDSFMKSIHLSHSACRTATFTLGKTPSHKGRQESVTGK